MPQGSRKVQDTVEINDQSGKDDLKMKVNYKIGFELWGLVLFLIIMIPNIIWFAVPAPNDIMRADSITPTIDSLGSICQILFIIALCILKRKGIPQIQINPLIIMVIISVLLYFTGWIFYYTGVTNPLIILLLILPPCCAFILFEINRKNVIALIPTIGFTVCHIIFAVINFII